MSMERPRPFTQLASTSPPSMNTDRYNSEGLITAVIGIASYWVIPDWPETAHFLNATERELLVARLSTDVADAKMNRLDRPAMKRIFSDWKIYVSIIMYVHPA